ncbi:MAG: N-acetyltransferase [Bacteroidales bacterium]|nr:N-acetyltransferase [Bacteroidales bacterium]
MNNDFFVHETAVIDFPCKIGKNTKIWHFSHLMEHCQIGEDCILGQNVFVASEVVVGNRVKIQNNVSLFAGVTCEDEVFIGPSVVFTNVLNPRSAVNRKNEFRATNIGKGATIGANSTIVCGHQIGKYAFIGAGSVVTHDVPDYAMVLGNPARRVGWMSENGQKLSFDKDGFALCPTTGEKYQLTDNQVVKL